MTKLRRAILTFLVILLSINMVPAQDNSLYFKGNVYEGLATAQRQKKMLIVEFYAAWSYKSRWMNENVISHADISKAIRENFIIVQVDTQTKDGAKLAETYQIADYPTLVVFDQNGKVVDKIDRTSDRDDFLARLDQIVIQNDGKSAWEIHKILAASQKGDAHLVDQLTRNYIERVGKDKVVSQFHWEFFSNSSIIFYGSYAFEFILKNKDAFNKTYGVVKVDELIKSILIAEIIPYTIGAYGFDNEYIENYVEVVKSANCSYTDILLKLAELPALRQNSDIDKYLASIEDLISYVPDHLLHRLLMSVEFVVSTGNKDQKRTAYRILEKHGHTSNSLSETKLIITLEERLLE